MMDNPWIERRVIAFAHQGGAHEGPSSCLATIAAALAVGATAIELDVHMTSDGVLVVCHDETIDRTTSGRGAICDLTLAEIKAQDNAYWWVPGADVSPGLSDDAYPHRGLAPNDQNYAVATLTEVLERFPDVVLNMDIKRTAPEVVPYEHKLADLLRAYDRAHNVIVASFNDAAIASFRDYAPEFSTSMATLETAAFYQCVQAKQRPERTSAIGLQVPATFGDIVLVDQDFVDAAHNAGLVVHVWTINEADAMDQLLELGVDGIISDRPTMLVERIEQRGLTWNGV